MQDKTNTSKPDENQNQLEIELTEQEASGTYSNLVMITHSASEFILDFIAVMPGAPKAKVLKRMVLTPDHAKRLSTALTENVRRFEEQFGEIETQGHPNVNMSYRGPIPEA